jgi:hypothetical protein
MNTTSAQTVTEYEQHRVDMLLWQADVHERNGRKQEAFEIRVWVTDFLSAQSGGREMKYNILAGAGERQERTTTMSKRLMTVLAVLALIAGAGIAEAGGHRGGGFHSTGAVGVARSRMNSSFMNRPATTSATVSPRRPMSSNTDLRESRLISQPPPSNSFVNRSLERHAMARRQTSLGLNNHWQDPRFREQPRTSNSFLNRSDIRDAAVPRNALQPFNRERTNNSFVNRSVAANTAFRRETRVDFNNNWRGSEFAGRQYWAFRNYQSQWHDSYWWSSHCDRIAFVTVYSQPFPFYFDAGYWYPAWGPYDGPIYGYNDLPPDEVITNVQMQLYNDGYYAGPIDGILGPDTRAAIADYQADHWLAVTAAIDESTVASLGLI